MDWAVKTWYNRDRQLSRRPHRCQTEAADDIVLSKKLPKDNSRIARFASLSALFVVERRWFYA